MLISQTFLFTYIAAVCYEAILFIVYGDTYYALANAFQNKYCINVDLLFLKVNLITLCGYPELVPWFYNHVVGTGSVNIQEGTVPSAGGDWLLSVLKG